MVKKEYRSRAFWRIAAVWTVLTMSAVTPLSALADGPGGSSSSASAVSVGIAGPGAESGQGPLPTVTEDYPTIESTVHAGEAVPAVGGGTGTGTAASSAAVSSEIAKPEISSEAAALYDVTHGQFLFEKNSGTRFYPASITKVMTALLAAENLNPDQTVTVSEAAVSNLESGAVTLDVKAGDTFRAGDVLYGMWLKSANELANVLAEAVSGSVSSFVGKMNARAAQIGATGTHFANTNGLNDSNHYTTAHDYALITAEAFRNATVQKVASSLHYTFPATGTQGSQYLTMGHKMLNPASAYYYENFIGGKTGYTSKAGNTLVSVAERGGVRLVAVILKSSATHYADTKKLFDYGFAVTGASGGTPAVPETAAQSETAAVQETAAAQEPRPEAGSAPVTVTEGPGAGSAGAVQETAAAAVPESTAAAETVSSGKTGWEETAEGWKYRKADGSYAKDEELLIKEKYYIFDSNAVMLKGWNYARGSWRYYGGNGDMKSSRWIETNGMWYYVTEDGSLLVNGTSPDGYKVDANGVWIK